MTYNEDLAKRMREILKTKSNLVEKKMFGGIGFLVNGNMACGVNKQDLVLRLSDNDFEKALKQPNVRIFNMSGRPMKGWVMISTEGYRSDRSLLAWVEKGMAFAQSLPPK
jgi:TfoX/Sxy family transcriptional regulator of competence genes